MRRARGATLTAAFAHERDAQVAIRMLGSIDAPISCTLRPVLGERGDVQLVILEATFDDRRLAPRLETIVRGAHGVPLRPDPEAAAAAS